MSLIFDSLKALESTSSSTPAALSSTTNTRFTKALVPVCVVGALGAAYMLWDWQSTSLVPAATTADTKVREGTQRSREYGAKADPLIVVQPSDANAVTTDDAQVLPLQIESPSSAPVLESQKTEQSVEQVAVLAEPKTPHLTMSTVDTDVSDIDVQQPQNANARAQTEVVETPILVKPEVKIDLNVKAQAKQSLAQRFGDIRRAMQLQDWEKLSILLQEYDADLSATSPFITKAWAYMYMQQANYQQAISYWKKAIYLVPTDEQSRMNLAVCQMQLKSYDEARALLEQGFKEIILQNRARDLLSRLRYLQSLQVSS
ncbi:tetratricopeptide repeat protein [Pseudoalteromonas sp. J010]|uniref:tetratricopeptide repeat protein n=1 Tax=Pseudoalteromonas sp. J010 TaxID=998465 RepID=UPI000F653366|nr:tetratricopeptide repeat protein [Pseudoalteromonas sp. J010]RRS10576.1 tetratricopeptide repeat protein [Pseudoalteromonas sp. J010]